MSIFVYLFSLGLSLGAECVSLPQMQLLPGHRVVLHGEWPLAAREQLASALTRVRPRLATVPLLHDVCVDEVAFGIGQRFGVEDRSRLDHGFGNSYRKLAVTIDENASVEDIVSYLAGVLPPLRIAAEKRWAKLRTTCARLLR